MRTKEVWVKLRGRCSRFWSTLSPVWPGWITIMSGSSPGLKIRLHGIDLSAVLPCETLLNDLCVTKSINAGRVYLLPCYRLPPQFWIGFGTYRLRNDHVDPTLYHGIKFQNFPTLKQIIFSTQTISHHHFCPTNFAKEAPPMARNVCILYKGKNIGVVFDHSLRATVMR